MRKLVQLHCDHIRKIKLEKYKQHLESLKKPFLEEKRQTFKWIAETERKLGLPVSVQEDQIEPNAPLQLESGSAVQNSQEKSPN